MYIKIGEKTMKKLIAIFFAVIVLTAAFVGCNNTTTNETVSMTEEERARAFAEEQVKKAVDVINAAFSEEVTGDPTAKLNTILADVKKAYEADTDYFEFISSPDYFSAIDVDMLADLYLVDKANIEVVVAEMCGMITSIDRFVGIKAVDGKGEDVANALRTFHENSKENLAFYPQNAAKTEAAKIIAHGDYVFYIILGNNPPIETEADNGDEL